MKTLVTTFLILLGTLGLGQPVFSQTLVLEAEATPSAAAAQKVYAAAFTNHSQLINGPEYIDYSKPYHVRTGHQFFLSPDKQSGSIYYNDHDFSDLQLAYDLVLDQVVISPLRSPLTLRLINENVRSFSLAGHRFVRLVADSSSNRVIRTGFYELLLDSTVQVLAKRSKRMQEHVAQQYVSVEFTAKDALFIKKGGAYYPVSRKAAALRLFSDHAKEMQDYVKDHKLSFKKEQLEASVLQLAGYYSSLR